MKKFSYLILMLSFLFCAGMAQAQSEEMSKKSSKLQTVKIQTSAQCEMCKTRIEETLAFEKGVKLSNLNLEDMIVTVSYNAKKTNVDKIRKAISNVGYQADEVLADPKAYEKLPACCQLGGHDHEMHKEDDH